MDLLPVGFMLGSVIGGCVAQSENYCPSPPVPTNTSKQNLPYVEREMENEWCFFDRSEAAGGLPCRVGYHCNLIGPSCLPCPHDEIKTYQPKQNNCPKCILCTDCEKEGMEEVSRCTRGNNAVCQKRSPQSTDKYYPTTEGREEDTRPPSKDPSSPVTQKLPIQDELGETDDTDETCPELEKLRKQNTLLKWIVSFAVPLLVISLAGHIYKLIKRFKSSSTSGGREGNQNSGPGSVPGESSTLMSGEEQRQSNNIDGSVNLENIGQSTDAQSIQNNSETINDAEEDVKDSAV